MRLMRILIVLILCVKSLYRALPVQSKALENIDDQLFWQAAWFSEDRKPASPFTSDSKKITAKSIFITPNFINQPAPYCPDGYRVDNGKCIKIINIHQTSEEMLATRLSSLITTDDTTNFDYDYDSFEDEPNNEQNQEDIKLPLVPILHESNEDETDSNSNINAKNVTVKEYGTEVTTDNPFMSSSTFHDFRTENKTDSVEIIITTLSSDDDVSDTTYEHDNPTIKPSVDEFHENSNDDDVNENFSSTFSNTTTSPQQIDPTTTTTTTEAAIALEYENITEKMSSNENETSVMQDLSNEDNQNVEPSFLLLPLAVETLERENSTKNNNNFTIIDSNSTINIKNSSYDVDDDDDEILSNSTVLDFNENSQTEESIIESSDTINFDDTSFLVNDSLIMIDNASSILNSSSDYDDYITTIDPFMKEDQTTLQTSDDSDNVSIKTSTTDENTSITDEDKTSAFKYETTSYYSLDDRQNSNGNDETNKFVYHHHVPTAATTATTIETSTQSVKGNKLKFPDEEINNRVRFPDDYNNNNDEIVTTSSRIQSRLIPSSSTSATSRFSWPRDNNHRLTTNIFQYWNQQPLLEDYQRARENSKSFRADDFFPYTRKVQIVTPQRYNY
ncbi:unnamed protein product [Chironomus riparius]|uniref:Folded gastrulation N-terminal domain-containing protein n=1 Tax=Chironomus riparius TaxID=315576 RepID=A0A9N9WTR6_9DIPT|nr:unnamed protein product [Chironomus riparius]